ncbi:WD repeat-containing protein 43-like [Paramacrobiotus metropolitanus]|uniref:WD repeat-containing protein 43-like n=1 Tax=Paramacrobiotus metropolitanus TaxID=2943436 RepID=UPI002446478E|nr:WD repeat-containing protein 43-like [Paramacrobiotus metropolitanus]
MPKQSAAPNSRKTAEPTVSYGTPRAAQNRSHGEAASSNHNDTSATASELSSRVPSEPSLGEILQRAQNSSGEPESGPPRADSLAVLLEQGLKSGDLSLLNSVLDRSDETIIRKTIENLPVQYTVSLIQHLGKVCAEERAKPNKAPLHWLSAVLTIRSSYLTTVPDLPVLLSHLYAHADRRTKYTDRFVKLAGVVNASVDLAKQRISQRTEAQLAEKKAILVYNEPLDDTSTSESDDDDANANESDLEMPSNESDANSSSDSNDEPHSRKKRRKSPTDTESEEEDPRHRTGTKFPLHKDSDED